MKKRGTAWKSVLLTVVLFLTMLPFRAEAAGGSLQASASTLRAGDTFKVTYAATNLGINAYSLKITANYSADTLELTGTSCLWSAANNHGTGSITFAGGDNTQTKAFSGGTVVTLTFKVKSSAAAGAALSVSVSGDYFYGMESKVSAPPASWSSTVAAPLSGNADLSALSCSGGTLSPSFAAGTTRYSVTVPYAVSKLSLQYTAEDKGAKVSVSNTALQVGTNTITVTVTAANGTAKRYTITATRQQDPNYVASKDASLSALSASEGTLSPAFSPERKEYVLYVPYETEKVSVSGTAADGKARSVTPAEETLAEGDNLLTVVCTAEDGATQETYTVHVYRMPLYEETLPEITMPEPEKDPEQEPQQEPEPEKDPVYTLELPQTVALPLVGEANTLLVGGIILGLMLLLLLLLAFLLGRGSGRRADRMTEEDEEEEEDEEPEDSVRETEAEEPAAPEEAPANEAEAAPEKAPEAEDGEELSMSLDDILRDIRNMK